jgi:hypothetical protein
MNKLFRGRRFAEVEVGESFFDSLTITETHFILGCGLSPNEIADGRSHLPTAGRD